MVTDSNQPSKCVSHRRKPTLLPHVVDLNDPASFRPLAMGTHAALLWPFALMQGWMTKYTPPAYSFIKTKHRRFVIIVDRMVYTFKADNPQHDFREFFELTPNTSVSLTDQFSGCMHCIELERREDGRTWYLEPENVEDLNLWLDRLKGAIEWLRRRLPGVITLQTLGATSTTAAAALAVDSPPISPSRCFYFQGNMSGSSSHLFLPPNIAANFSLLRPSRLPDVLPPQLPPPTSRPPPPPPFLR
ncbi:hypothetical protein BX666DRAFT_1953270 [Dichotomocladium elegans]|nr:hypothetical protein BX666DRAFT_1953270 [Dichotomocladium elegans]